MLILGLALGAYLIPAAIVLGALIARFDHWGIPLRPRHLRAALGWPVLLIQGVERYTEVAAEEAWR